MASRDATAWDAIDVDDGRRRANDDDDGERRRVEVEMNGNKIHHFRSSSFVVVRRRSSSSRATRSIDRAPMRARFARLAHSHTKKTKREARPSSHNIFFRFDFHVVIRDRTLASFLPVAIAPPFAIDSIAVARARCRGR